MQEQSAQARWEHLTQRPLLALAVAFAVAYAVPIVDSSAGQSLTAVCTAVEWVVWGAFAADYVVRLALSRHRREFVRGHWLDLCAVVLPMVQPLRLLRMVVDADAGGAAGPDGPPDQADDVCGRRGRGAADVRLAGRAVGGAGVAGREHPDAG